MHHYIYKITDNNDGNFYIGKRSTSSKPENDTYYGSGYWILNLAFEMTGRIHKPSVYKKTFTNYNIKKEILCVCDTEIEAYSKEKDYILSYRNDPLCRNMNSGGKGFDCGELHPHYDDTIYVFKNLDGNEIVTTKNKMIEYLKCNKSCVYEMVKNDRPMIVKGFYFAGTPEMPLTIDLTSCNIEKYKKYEFVNFKKETVVKTRTEMVKYLDCSNSSIQSLIEGRTKTIKGFALKTANFNHEYIFRTYIPRKWICDTNVEYLNVLDLKNKYNLSKGIYDVLAGKTRSHKGWKLSNENAIKC